MTIKAEALPGGVVHDLPDDFASALRDEPVALSTWHDITPLARNEWICWVTSPKKAETRQKRILWGRDKLAEDSQVEAGSVPRRESGCRCAKRNGVVMAERALGELYMGRPLTPG